MHLLKLSEYALKIYVLLYLCFMEKTKQSLNSVIAR